MSDANRGRRAAERFDMTKAYKIPSHLLTPSQVEHVLRAEHSGTEILFTEAVTRGSGVECTYRTADAVAVLYHGPISRPDEWVEGPRGGVIADPVAWVGERLGLAEPAAPSLSTARAEQLITGLRALYSGRITDDLLDVLDLGEVEREILLGVGSDNLSVIEAAIRAHIG